MSQSRLFPFYALLFVCLGFLIGWALKPSAPQATSTSDVSENVISVAPFGVMDHTCSARVYRKWSYVYQDEKLQDVSPSSWWKNFELYGQVGEKSDNLQMEAYAFVGVRKIRQTGSHVAVQVYFFDETSRQPVTVGVPDSWMKANDLNLEDCDVQAMTK